jgi:hypothetical protein
MTEPSRIQKAIDRCAEALFTGKLRVVARQADGEVWFLSGIVERMRFGADTGETASRRMLSSDVTRVDAKPCLPNPNGGFDRGHATDGALGEVTPVDLLRFCETHALTCKIDLESAGVKGNVEYRLGELVSVRCDAGGDRAVAKMLEWNQGRFRFELPRVELAAESTDSPPSIPPPSMPRPDVEDAAERAAAAARMRAAADEARKRRAEELEKKRQAEEIERQREAELAAERAAEAEAERARAVVVPPPPPSKRKSAERAPNRAQRRAEMKARGELAPESTRTMKVRLVRVTTDITTVTVPISDAVTRAADEGGAAPRVDAERLFAEAVRIANKPGTRWQREGEPRVTPHAEQPPLFDSGDLIRRS